jgi:rubredoxin
MSEETEEIKLAKNFGEQISGKIYCPNCSTEKDKQLIYVFGDCEDSLFCPHCELTINLTVIL